MTGALSEQQEMERDRIESEIRGLVSELTAPTSPIGDWKVIKCYEAKLQGKPLPYDLDELMNARQAVRDRINVLEAQLAEFDK